MTLGIAVSVGSLYFAARDVEWAQVGTQLAGARVGWLVGVMVASFAALYIRAQRWRVLLRPLGDVPLYPALSATAIGAGASAVFPFRLGEIVRPALLGRRCGVSVSAAFSSVLLERLFDVLLVIGCFIAASLIYPEVPANVREGAYALGGIAVVAFVVLLIVHRQRERAERVLARRFRWLPFGLGRRLQPIVRSFMEGLGGLGGTASVLLLLAYSAYLWAVIALPFMFSFLALDIPVPLVAGSLITLVVVALFIFLPQAPGFLGTWQLGCVLALGFFRVDREVAFSYGLLTWLLQQVFNIGTALLFVARDGISLRQLLRLTPTDASGGAKDRSTRAA